MAKKITITLVDDIDGTSSADETVSFSLDGVSYEIDLSADNAGKLREMFAAVEAVGSDVDRRSHLLAGSILVGRMTVAGGD